MRPIEYKLHLKIKHTLQNSMTQRCRFSVNISFFLTRDFHILHSNWLSNPATKLLHTAVRVIQCGCVLVCSYVCMCIYVSVLTELIVVLVKF